MRRIKSQIIENVCDNVECGKHEEFEMIGLNEDVVTRLEAWRVITREVFMGGEFTKYNLLACSPSCGVAVDLQFETKKNEAIARAKQAEQEQLREDNIDLKSLQVN